jgi:hypothetical protein
MDDFISSVDPHPHDFIGQTLSFVTIKISSPSAKMIHSVVWDSERFVLKDDQQLHMVKLVGAVRNFHVNIKHVQIDVEDGTGLVRIIL